MNKTVKILLTALAALVLAGAIGFMILYFNVNAIRFDYVEAGWHSPSTNSNVVYPFFGNKLMLGESGPVYGPPLGLGMKNIRVYLAVNDPISTYTHWISRQYEGGVQITDYIVENDGKTLTVKLSGTANNGGETIPIEKVFIFDIENASFDNLPTWTNRTEADNEFYPV